jgi:hypothetical protein
MSGNEARLRLEPRQIDRIARIPEALDKGASTRELFVAVNQDPVAPITPLGINSKANLPAFIYRLRGSL